MIVNWFDTKEVERFAVSLGEEFIQRVPVSAIKESAGTGGRLLDAATQVLLVRIDKFVAGKKNNFYKKACFGNKFKWHLKDAGYPDAMVDSVVLAVVRRFAGVLPSKR